VRGCRKTLFGLTQKDGREAGSLRVNTLRVIAVALAVVLLYANIYGFAMEPDVVGLTNVIGLGVLFFCAVLMTDRAGRFVRTAVVAAVMIFVEAIRLFNLTEAASVVGFFNLLYLFLSVLLVITAADGIGQFSQLHGQESIARSCDVTGHVFALTFVFNVLGMWLDSLSSVFALINLVITGFVIIMFIYFFSAVIVPVEQPYDMPPDLPDDDTEEEMSEGDEEDAEAAVGAEIT
jgi:hypothetical protein